MLSLNSKFKEVADLFGVQLGEHFKIKNVLSGKFIEGCSFYFDKDDIKEVRTNDSWRHIFTDLLRGEYEVVKLPFKPKQGDTYYIITIDGAVTYLVCHNSLLDLAYFYMGNCFRTKEEAKAHKDVLMKKFRKIMVDKDEQ